MDAAEKPKRIDGWEDVLLDGPQRGKGQQRQLLKDKSLNNQHRETSSDKYWQV
jgi:hypothetical protein